VLGQSAPIPFAEQRSGHEPYLSRNCTACHEPELEPRGELPPAESPIKVGPALRPIDRQCVSCHDLQSQTPVRGHPSSLSFCNTCHNPHNSRGRRLLLDEDRSRECLDFPAPARDKSPLEAPRRSKKLDQGVDPQPDSAHPTSDGKGQSP
jgi:predicted CXXCH cytochrome family protein